jgi:urea transport system permease protein
MRAVVGIAAVMAALATVAQAGPAAAPGATPELARLVAELGSPDSPTVVAAIAALADRREPAAAEVLVALQDGRLRVLEDGRVVVAGADETLRDPVVAAPVRAAGPARPLRVDNAIRRALGPAVARSRLHSLRVDDRRAAAATLARAPAADLVPYLRERRAVETDALVRERLALALAHGDLASDDAGLRLAAVRAIAASRATGFRPRLEARAAVETDPAVVAAIAETLSTLRWREGTTRVVRDVAYGLSQGSLLLLVAIGLAITFGLMGVINMAHGEMLMLGAYTTYAVQAALSRHWPAAWPYYLALAVPAAFAVCLVVGMILERTVIRHLYGRALETLLATWGVSLILIQAVRLIFGAQNVSVANPPWLSGGWELADGVVLPYTRVATIGFAAAVVVLVALILRRTSVGLQVRAIMQNRGMARCLGVPTPRVDTLTFGLGSAIAGLGGVALSQIGNVGPEMGQLYIVDSFMVVVVGGVGKLIGTVVTALGLGVVNKALEPMAGAVLGKIIVLAAIILFIQRRPQGLFAPRGRASEA